MKKIFTLIIVACLLTSCAVYNEYYKKGLQASMNKDFEKAIKYYELALKESPKNSVYRMSLIRAKIEASIFHLKNARELLKKGDREEALKEYRNALNYDPSNLMIIEEMVKIEEKKEVEKEKVEELQLPVRIKPIEEKLKMKFTETSLKSIFQALSKWAEVNILFDETFRDIPITISLEDMNFEQALGSLCMVSKNFWRVVDPKTLIIVPDNPIKRRQYEVNALKTFYLQYADPDSLRQIISLIFRTQNIAVDKTSNSITVRESPFILNNIEKIIKKLDKPTGEVLIELEIMEVNRTKLQQYGIDFGLYTIGMKYEPPESLEGWISIDKLTPFKSSDFFLNIPTSFLRFLETDAHTKIIAQPKLRGVDSKEISFLITDKIPVPITTFTPFAGGGIPQQPVVSYEYKDVGIVLKITPKIHSKEEISLEVKISITSLAGYGYADLPIIGNREVSNIIRLKEGETSFLAGLLRDDERKSLKGLAGIRRIPILGDLLSTDETQITQTDIILTLTPHIVRILPIQAKDLEPLWIGPEEGAALPGSFPYVELRPEERLIEEIKPEEVEKKEVFNSLSFVPSSIVSLPEKEFDLSIVAEAETPVSNINFSIKFDPKIAKAKDVSLESFFYIDGKPGAILKNIDNSAGEIFVGISSPILSKGASGIGPLLKITFQAISEGTTIVEIMNLKAYDAKGKNIDFYASPGEIRVEKPQD
ncbi:MAG: secretin N-terminal domain-containing protein [Acidobacteriota bacterium]